MRDELERETRATPARPDTIVAAGSAPLERLPVISHRPHPAARGHAHPPVRIQRRRPDHRHRPTTPATRPSNSSPGWCQPTSPPPRRLVTPQTTPALTDPAAWRPAPMASPARATHTGSPRRPGQATTRIPAGKCAPPPTSPQRRDRPTQVIGNQFKQVHKWQICVQFRHRRPGTWARKYPAICRRVGGATSAEM